MTLRRLVNMAEARARLSWRQTAWRCYWASQDATRICKCFAGVMGGRYRGSEMGLDDFDPTAPAAPPPPKQKASFLRHAF